MFYTLIYHVFKFIITFQCTFKVLFVKFKRCLRFLLLYRAAIVEQDATSDWPILTKNCRLRVLLAQSLYIGLPKDA